MKNFVYGTAAATAVFLAGALLGGCDAGHFGHDQADPIYATCVNH